MTDNVISINGNYDESNPAPMGSSGPPSDSSAGARGRGKPPTRRTKPVFDAEIYQSMFSRYTLLYPSKEVFDHQLKIVALLADVTIAFPDHVKLWKKSPRREMINIKDLIFDASKPVSATVPGTINLFEGIEMKPKKGVPESYQLIEDALRYICKEDEVFNWVLKWIAYPLQHLGAKMQTAIIMHGDEGTGKSFFWVKVISRIYGKYAGTIGQSQLESQFNEWASKKLFLLAEEVVSRAEMASHKGRLKHLITGETILINPKNLSEKEEKNQANFVFLSNETQPNKLDPTDRRYCVIFTPPAQPLSFYKEVEECIDAGGVEAFYHMLLNLDLGDFNEHTKPPENEDKLALKDISKSPPHEFFDEWFDQKKFGEPMTCTADQMYCLFAKWAGKAGIRFVPTRNVFSREFVRIGDKFGVKRTQEPRLMRDNTLRKTTFIIVGTPPPDKLRQVWLSECEQNFDEYLKDELAHVI